MKKIIVYIIVLCFIFSCKKENLSDNIEIFSCGTCLNDQSFGKADKNVPEWGSKEWLAAGLMFPSKADSSRWDLGLGTKSEQGESREEMFLYWLPLKKGTYKIKKTDDIEENTANATYGRHGADGDLILAVYFLDSLNDNFVTITSVDLIAKRVKGTFNVHFKQGELTSGTSGLPQNVNFLNGEFDVKIKD